MTLYDIRILSKATEILCLNGNSSCNTLKSESEHV